MLLLLAALAHASPSDDTEPEEWTDAQLARERARFERQAPRIARDLCDGAGGGGGARSEDGEPTPPRAAQDACAERMTAMLLDLHGVGADPVHNELDALEELALPHARKPARMAKAIARVRAMLQHQ